MRRYLYLLCFLIFNISTLCQSLHFQYYNSTKDFPSRRIWSLFQDNQGVMWFGDIEGLLRYDGITYTLYQERHGIPGTPILSMCEKGDVLIAGTTNGLALFKDGKAEKVLSIPTSPVRALLAHEPDGIWVGTGVGLFLYNKNGSESILPEEDIRAIGYFEDQLFIGTRNGEIIAIKNPAKKESRVIRTVADVKRTVRSIINHNGQLFIGASSGLFKLEGDTIRSIEVGGNQKTGVSKIVSDGADTLWLGTWGQNLISYQPETGKSTVFDNDSGIPSPFITDMMFDQEKNLWIAFYNGGVIKYSDKNFLHYPIRGGSSITRLNIDSKGNIWFTSSRYGLMNMQKGSNEPTIIGGTPVDEPTYGLFVDSKDRVWQLQPEKIYRFDGPNMDIFTPPDTQLRKGALRWLFEDSQGRIWFGGTRGLARLEGETLVDITPKGDPKKRFWHSLERSDKSLIFSSITKLWHYKDDFFVEIPFDKGQGAEIHSLLETKDNGLLVGTSNGLFLIHNTGKTSKYILTHGFNVSRLFKDSKGRIWAGSRSGIWEIKGEKSIVSYLPKSTMGSIENIIEDSSGTLWFISHNRNVLFDGLQWTEQRFPNNLAIQSFNPIPTDKDGVTWFATNKGLTSYNPQKQTKSRPAPMIRSCYIQTNQGKRIPIQNGDTIKLLPSEKNFTLHFQSHSFINEALNRYKLKIDGPDSVFRLTKEPRKEFMNMAPGVYSISVTPINGINVEAKKPFTFEIHMASPFWKSPLAMFGFFLIAILLIYLISKYLNYRKVKFLQQRNIWLEHELKEKTASLIEAKKRETASALTTTLSDEIAQPLMSIQGTIDLYNQSQALSTGEQQEMITKIQDSIARISNVLRKLRELDSIKFDEYTPGISMVQLNTPDQKVNHGILFVDDEEDLLEIWGIYFKTLGYHVFTANSVEGAIRVLEEFSSQIHIIVSDNKMPEKTGFDLLIQTQEMGLKQPFFILTGFDVEPQLKAMLSKGLQGIIQKPIMLNALHDILKPSIGDIPAPHQSKTRGHDESIS